MSKSKKSLSKISVLMFIITLISRLILLYQKYKVSRLEFINYNWLNIGNLINLTLIIIFVAIFFLNRRYFKEYEKFLLSIAILNLLLIVLPIKLELISVKLSNAYIFNTAADKLFNGAMILIVEFGFVYQIAICIMSRLVKTNFIFIKSILLSGNYFLILLMFTYLFVLKSPSASESEIPVGKNLGVVLGAAVWNKDIPSPLFQSRIKKAYFLLRNGKIHQVLLTGGMAPGEVSEANAAFNLLSSLGVPSQKMILENKTSTTLEQIKFIAHKKDFSKFDNILIISDSFHLARVHEMSKFFNLSVYQIPSGHELYWEKLLYFRIRETFALLLFWLFGI